MVDIADDTTNNWIEREGLDGKKVRVCDPENIRRCGKQIGALKVGLRPRHSGDYIPRAEVERCPKLAAACA